MAGIIHTKFDVKQYINHELFWFFCQVIFALFGTVVNAAIGLHCWCSKSSDNVIGKFLPVNTLALFLRELL